MRGSLEKKSLWNHLGFLVTLPRKNVKQLRNNETFKSRKNMNFWTYSKGGTRENVQNRPIFLFNFLRLKN